MERDVTGWLHKGETVPNLVAGLSYSIALNYLNRVVRGRKIGKVIYFQGGTRITTRSRRRLPACWERRSRCRRTTG